MEEQHPSTNNSRDMEYKIPITEAEGEDHHHYFDGRRIHKVPQYMRFKKHNEEDYYAPKMVSFGPNYNGFPELGMAGEDREFFYCQIFKVIDQIRNCYIGVSKDAYDDVALAKMMLLDASFSIYLMEMVLGDGEKNLYFCRHLGLAATTFAYQDMYLLENQIPHLVITLLINLIYGKGSMLPCHFLNFRAFGDYRLTRIPEENEMQPLHLLDAFRQLHVKEYDNAAEILDQPINKCQWWP